MNALKFENDLASRPAQQPGHPALRVHPVVDGDAERWDRFVRGHVHGSLFQLFAWKRLIEKTFNFEATYFSCERDGEITGVAPVFCVSNWLVGRALISVPLGVYGGICAKDVESEAALVDHIKRFGLEQGVEYIELRTREGNLYPDFHKNPRYVTFTAPLLPDHEANWKRLPRDTRYMIRKAEKAGLRIQHGWHQIADFYRLFAISMRRLGTPVFPKSLFTNICQEFGESTDLMLVYADSKPIAGVLSFLYQDTILPYYAGAAPEAARWAANNFMYWELMKKAVEWGLTRFDFGRSKKGTGAYAFKSSWRMDLEPLSYQVHLVHRKTLPDFSPVNPKFELATRIWKHLPLSLTKQVGPRIVRWFP